MLGCKGWKGQKKGIVGIKIESTMQREHCGGNKYNITVTITFENLFRVIGTDELFKYIYPEWLL